MLNLVFFQLTKRLPLYFRRSKPDEPEQLFVQTDKFVYKPGQLVRFRIFSVDSELKPVVKPVSLKTQP